MKESSRQIISEKAKQRWQKKAKCLCWKCKRIDCIQIQAREKLLNNSKTTYIGGDVVSEPNLTKINSFQMACSDSEPSSSCSLTIKGTVEDCRKISADLVKRYGNITVLELAKKLNIKDMVML